MLRRIPFSLRLRALAFGAAAALLPFAASTAMAQSPMLCSKPLPPLCSTDVQQFADETERERCVGDTDRYLDELRAYQDCLREALTASDQSMEQAEDFKSCVQEGRDDCGIDSDESL